MSEMSEEHLNTLIDMEYEKNLHMQELPFP